MLSKKFKSCLNLGSNILKSNLYRCPLPYKLTFAITYRCNYKCKTCNIWQRNTESELSFNEIEQFFNQCNSYNWIDLTGGEVWLRDDFIDIVQLILCKCSNLVLLHFPTNSFMTDRIVKGVKEIIKMKFRPPKIVISCSTDGDEIVNDSIRGVKGGWKRQIETYKQLHAISGVQVYLGMTMSSFNVDHYDKAFASIKKECQWLSPSDFHMNIAHQSSHYYGNLDVNLLPKDESKLILQVKKYRNLRGIPLGPMGFLEWCYLKNVDQYLISGTTPMPCHALRSSCFIDPMGDIYPCSMYDRKLGNLRDLDYNLKLLWDDEQTIKLQQEIWCRICPQCWTPCEAYQSIFGNIMGLRKFKYPSNNQRRPFIDKP